MSNQGNISNKAKNRFYNWIARQITVESQQGIMLPTVKVRVYFKNIYIAGMEYEHGKYSFKLINKSGNYDTREQSDE